MAIRSTKNEPLSAMLEIRGVRKSFGNTEALGETDLTIARGQTTALIGPSGCGKSTLLRVIIALVEPDEGEVRFDGVPIGRENLLEIRRRMGYVIQEGGLFAHLSVRDNTTLMARHLRWEPRRIDDRLRELCALTRFPRDGLDRFPTQISGGQRQRVGLMRALMLDPEVLLMDEPLGALDPIIRSELQDDLRDIFQTLDKTVVLVTHDLGEAAFFGDTIVLLSEGRIVQRGTYQQLIDEPADPFVTQFINAQRSPLESLRNGKPASGA